MIHFILKKTIKNRKAIWFEDISLLEEENLVRSFQFYYTFFINSVSVHRNNQLPLLQGRVEEVFSFTKPEQN